MVLCPWCGTSYAIFQSSCSRCGGPLQAAEGIETPGKSPIRPPAAPRVVSDSYVFKLMGSEGWSICGLVFLLLGGVFATVGLGLTFGLTPTFIGLLFLALGGLFLAAGAGLLIWRYQENQKQVRVLKWGDSTLGKIVDVQENRHVRVNGRHPWIITFRYTAYGQSYTSQASTFNPPQNRLQPGREVYVLYLDESPAISSVYPHP